MYYEEKIIDGTLKYRTTPGGRWAPKKDARGKAITALMALNPNDRLSVFRNFCTACGDDNPGCNCRRDD